jgi:fibronectin-binding autotransporter adhesin
MKSPLFRAVLLLALVLLACGLATAQRQMEQLNRGVVAVRKSSTQIYVGWRLWGHDPAGVAFNLYRSTNGGAATKLNASPITATTDFTDAPANLSTNAYSYFVRPVVNGVEQPNSETASLPAAAPTRQYMSVPLRTDTGPNGPYDTKFAWVGDLDGDGDYDFVIDRLSTTTTAEQFLEAYTNDGIFLWRMAMGPNSVNQYSYEPGSSAISIGDTDNLTVYDMDGDGRAEVLVRTSNGVTVTNAAGTQVANITAANNSTQFLSVINGQSGAELGRATLPNPWAQHGTLTNKAAIAYLDGKRPSVIMYGYNRADSGAFYRVFTAWDYRNGAVTRRWSLAQDQAVLPGSEGHQIRIADVDNDGKDEICDIGHVIDDNGTQLFNTPLTHGDRFHIADIDPDRPGLETFAIQQYNPTMLATALYDSGTGAMIRKWYAGYQTDVGRGIALDISSAHKGYEFYSTQPGIFSAKGQRIYENSVWAPEGLWWDGDLGREFIDGAGSGALSPVVNKFNAGGGYTDRLYSIYNEGVHQSYGGRPAFWADILGDWREEIVFMANSYSELRIYTTTTAATSRLYTLMHNPQYRCQATTKGYVQASYVDYYLGYGMSAAVPPPPMLPSTLTWSGGNTWDIGASSSWKNSAGAAASFAQGDSVLFDISGSNAAPISLVNSLSPGSVNFSNPQDFTLGGSGSFTGGMSLLKSGKGKTTLTGTHSFTGNTTIWDGALEVNGQLGASAVTVRGGIWGGAAAKGITGGRLAGTGTVSQPVTLDYRGAITPGAGMGSAGTLTLGSNLTATDGSVLALDLSDDPTGLAKANDRVVVAGNLTLSGTVTVHINSLSGAPAPGTYTLLTYGGSLTGSVSNLAIVLPDGTPYALSAASGAITLTIPVTRAPSTLAWSGGLGGNAWDLANTRNWKRSGLADAFVAGDNIIFDSAGAANPSVNLTTALPVAGVTVNAATDYTLTGTGAIAGAGGITKSGTGTLTLTGTHTYTGATIISGGTLAVDNLNDGGTPSSIGSAGVSASNLVINGGTLALTGQQTNTNRSMTLGSSGGTISVPTSTSLQVSGQLTGSGSLTKTGSGTLILANTNNYPGGTLITGGNLLLATDSANVSGLGSGLVTLQGGTLSMTNDTGVSSGANSPWSIHVPQGSTGRLNADGRCTLSGALTGGGDFTFQTPFVRTELNGNWSTFTGRIFVVSDSDGGEFRILNPAGYPKASLVLGDKVSAFYNQTMSVDLTMAIGSLSGSATSSLRGGLTAGKTLTWLVGARNEGSTYAGAITNHTGPTALTKTGLGTLVLAGASTYTGATVISGGRLLINGSTSGSQITVQGGGTLGGSGAVTGNVTVQAGGALEHGGSGGTPLAITGNLTFHGNAIVLPAAGVSLGVGNYTLLTYSGTLTGTPDFTWRPPAGTRLIASFDSSTPGIVTMTLAETPRLPGPIEWTGAADFSWNTSTGNWLASGETVAFMSGDTPSFTDAGNATSAIQLTANVEPAGVIVNSSKNYSFGGTGVITGAAYLEKSGSGTLSIAAAHTYTGGTRLIGGMVAATSDAATAGIGSGPIIFNGGTLQQFDDVNSYNQATYQMQVPAGQSGTLRCDQRVDLYGSLTGSGTLNVYVPFVRFKTLGDWSAFAGTIHVTTDANGGDFRFANASGIPAAIIELENRVTALSYLNSNHTIPIGGLSGAVGSVLTGIFPDNNTPGANTVTWEIGNRNSDTTFSGDVKNGKSPSLTAIRKIGAGTLTLAGINTYTGPTTVNGGKLSITGSLATTITTVAAGGALGGTGSLGGPVICNGTLAPGTSAGILTLANGLTLSGTSVLIYELGSTSDLTRVTGNLTLDGTINITATAGFGAGSYTLLTYSGALTNNTLAVGSLPAGYAATVSTETAGQVRLIVTSTGNSAPVIVTPASATPPLTGGLSSALAVLATDDAGEGGLSYTWTSNGPGPVVFSENASNSAKNVTVTFAAPGSYPFIVTATDAMGLAIASETSVTVTATPTGIAVNPPTASLSVNASQAFAATVSDQFGNPLAGVPVTWSVSGGGTILPNGIFTATSAGGPFTITAAHGSLFSSAALTISKAAATVILGDLSKEFNGNPIIVSATTLPSGLPLQVTYDGSTEAPTAVGAYAVSATVQDANYDGIASGTLVIGKGTATISLGNLNVTYDGAPKPVTTTTVPAGLLVSLTYDASTTAPTAPGSYDILATIEDPDFNGTAAGTLVVSPRSMERWVETSFTPVQILAGEAAPAADPDHDGLTNLAEYALGGNPSAFTPQPSVTFAETSISITFQRPANIGDVAYHAEAGESVTTWEQLTLEVLNPGSDPEIVRATRVLPEPRPARNFLRLRFVK